MANIKYFVKSKEIMLLGNELRIAWYITNGKRKTYRENGKTALYITEKDAQQTCDELNMFKE
jgi:hypothetical protein